jgi:hypothetical protein
MSDRMSAEIWIGGKLRRELVPGLCEAICEEGRLSLDWGDTCFAPHAAEELIAGCQDRDGVRMLHLCDDEASDGQFDVLESYLVQAGICFRRHSAAKYEFDSRVVDFRPGFGRVDYSSNNSGECLVPLEKLTRIATAIDQAAATAEGQTALELLRRLRNLQRLAHENRPIDVPPLEAFEIVG